ncbi:MAG: hypothetical protein JST68_20700 [Bacteroidetes bacterium]|nr:hypothetical protein [Bacteroidota bacterium]
MKKLLLPLAFFALAHLFSYGRNPFRGPASGLRLVSDTGHKLSPEEDEEEEEEEENEAQEHSRVRKPPKIVSTFHLSAEESAKQSAAVEQTWMGTRPAPALLASFDGLGEGFKGPQGTAIMRSPSDNALAVGPDHIVQIVNSRMAIYTKKGKLFDSTGRVLYGPGETRNVFRGFGGPCEKMNNGDAVVRYDQLANRWLIVMPTFRRGIPRTEEKDSAHGGIPYFPQPGPAVPLYQPGPTYAEEVRPGGGGPRTRTRADTTGTYCMCYAISTGPDPMGSYYRYEFDRPLFPDYPRPTIWPDGYYTTSSTSDNLIQRQAFVVDRDRMLRGEPATEQGFLLDGVNFLLNSDVEGQELPAKGAPNIMVTNGGTQLNKQFEDDGIYYWKFRINWKDTSKSKLEGPFKIQVAPYHYMGDGQLTKAVPQPGTDQRLDSQGDKLLGRLIYRRLGKKESLVVVHSVNTAAGGGGVRWYEFRLGKRSKPSLYQQGTYAPGGDYRWLAGAAVDKAGNIGIGYSYGSGKQYTGQRFTGRLATDSLGVMSFREGVLVEGEDAQTTTLRWEDYTYTVVDPSDDETFWYVGDYMKKGSKNYTTRIGAFKLAAAAPVKK